MCGITGIVHYKGSPDKVRLQNAIDSIHHRGPDGNGMFLHGRIGLGHTRLSIIDVGSGAQPMFSATGEHVIVYNGELYNYKIIREELFRKGYVFKTHSDTEVVLNAFIEYGPDCVNKFNGIFAFAILNLTNDSLFLFRDQLGVKPLYFYKDDNVFCFGSEIKALFKLVDIKKEIDLEALDYWLTYRHVPSPFTLFNQVKKLNAGHYIEITKNAFAVRRFFAGEPKILDESFRMCVKIYQDKFERAVERQMMSDVPVGIMLSGGIDSALIGTLMKKYYDGNIKSYTVGFEEFGLHNELIDAKKSASIIGLDHNEIILNTNDFLDYFHNSFNYLEEPISTSSAGSVYAIAKAANRNNTKVLLSGQGADETLGGYRRHWAEKNYPLIKAIKQVPLLNTILKKSSNEQIRRAFDAMGESDVIDRLTKIYSIFNDEMKGKLLLNRINYYNPSIILKNWIEETVGMDRLSRIQYIDARNDLTDNLLIVADKMSMAASVELRVPFLDLELFKYLETVPSKYKIRGMTLKYFHKESAKKYLPPEIINRKKKGFFTPIDIWFRKNLGNDIRQQITAKSSACAQYFNTSYINEIIDAHQSKKADYHKNIFSLWAFETWYQQFYNKL